MAEEKVVAIIDKIAEKKGKGFAAGLVASINLTTPDEKEEEE